LAPSLTASYKVEDPNLDTASLVSGSFTPAAGDILVVKAVNGDAAQTFGALPTNTGFTTGGWTQRLNVGTSGASCRVAIFTATVSASAAGTVTLTAATASPPHAMVIERWASAQLAATPATASTVADTTYPLTISITTAQAGSVVSYACGDWNAVSPSGAAFTGDTAAPDQEQTATSVSSQYNVWWLTQAAASAGANTIGMSAPSGMSLTIGAIEIQGTGGGATTAAAGQATASGTAAGPLAGAATGYVYATADAAISGSWANLSYATGSTTGNYTTWTDSGTGTSAVLELSGFSLQSVIASGSTISQVRVKVRHSESPASQVASITAQAYLATSPYGSPQALTVSETVREDEVIIAGLAYADLADLRVRVTATRN
jgi:hypothetical protein